MSYENEYEVCQVRGHEASGVSTTIGLVTWQTCRWCSTEYHEGPPQIIEREDEPAWSFIDRTPFAATMVTGMWAESTPKAGQ